jgi:hypothetical protein
MSIVKTDEEITAEIAKLEDLKTKVRPHTYFGDSNIEKIEIEIAVLEAKEDLSDEYYDDPDCRTFAESAWLWLTGEWDAEEMGAASPSDSWQNLLESQP